MKSITRFTKNLHGNKCQNCQREISLEDNFCPTCGQVNDTQRLSIKHYLSEYLSGFFEFDNRFLRTVVPLLIKPGKVSKDYVNGRRIYYANPFQLYLHITILFFLTVGVFQTIDRFKPGAQGNSAALNELNNENTEKLIDSIKKETLLEIQKPEHGIDSVTLTGINEGIEQVSQNVFKAKDRDKLKDQRKLQITQLVDSVFQDSTLLTVFTDRTKTTAEKDSVAGFIMDLVDNRSAELLAPGKDLVISDWKDMSREWQKYNDKVPLNRQAANRFEEILNEAGSDYKIPSRFINRDDLDLPKNGFGRILQRVRAFMDYDKAHPDANVLQALDDLRIEHSYWNVFYYDKARELNEAMDDPDYLNVLMDRVLSRVSVALFFLLPVFTLIVSLLYIRRKYNYTENLVFVFHVQTVFFLLLLIFMIIGRFSSSGLTTTIFLTLFLFYLYKAMRNFYEQGRFKTIVKFILLNLSFMILAAIGAVIVSFLAFLS
jgi:ABC-type multidrug transport system permease subunit